MHCRLVEEGVIMEPKFLLKSEGSTSTNKSYVPITGGRFS